MYRATQYASGSVVCLQIIKYSIVASGLGLQFHMSITPPFTFLFEVMEVRKVSSNMVSEHLSEDVLTWTNTVFLFKASYNKMVYQFHI